METQINHPPRKIKSYRWRVEFKKTNPLTQEITWHRLGCWHEDERQAESYASLSMHCERHGYRVREIPQGEDY